MLIIGIAGLMGSGKDTAANIIKSEIYPNEKVKILKFATRLKKSVAALLDVSEEMLEDRKFKDSYVEELKSYAVDFWFDEKQKKHWGNQMYNTEYFNTTNERDLFINTKNVIVKDTQVVKPTVRQLLQEYGTKFLRGYNKEVHINFMKSEINKYKDYDVLIISDVRFHNELEFIVKYENSATLGLLRNVKGSRHASEDLTVVNNCEYLIDNNKDIEELTERLKSIF